MTEESTSRPEGEIGQGSPSGPVAGEREIASALAPKETPPELEVLMEAALERNARDAVVLDLRGLSDASDYFLIASGDSDTHTKAIADNLLRRLEERGYRPAGIEGKGSGRWILIDCIDVVAHIFLPGVRDFYQLERLWGDAPRFALE